MISFIELTEDKGGKNLHLEHLEDEIINYADVKKGMGFEPWEYSDTMGYATLLTRGLQKLKYDGVVSDKAVEGIVVFDKKNVTEVK